MAKRRPTEAADEQYVAQLVRELADTAPLAPSYQTLMARKPKSVRREDRPTWRLGFGVAIGVSVVVVAVLMIVGLADRSNRIETGPAEPSENLVPDTDQPTSTLGVMESQGQPTWTGYLDEADPVQVQLCIAKTVGTLLLDSFTVPPTDDAAVSSQRPLATTLQNLQTSEQTLTFVVDRSPVSATDAAAAEAHRQAFEAAQAERSNVSEGELAPLTETYVDARAANPMLGANPTNCWLDSAAGAVAFSEYREQAAEVDVVACLYNAQFSRALAGLAADAADDGWRDLVVTTGFEIRWNTSDPEAIAALQQELQLAGGLSTERLVEAGNAAVDRLYHGVEPLGPTGCPLVPER